MIYEEVQRDDHKHIEHCRACGNGWGSCNKTGSCVIKDDFPCRLRSAQVKNSPGKLYVKAYDDVCTVKKDKAADEGN